MTGEVTLQGKVLPIGGVKQKVLAAHRAGLTDVVIPARNEPDLDDVPDAIREDLHIHPVADVREVLELRPRVRPLAGGQEWPRPAPAPPERQAGVGTSGEPVDEDSG